MLLTYKENVHSTQMYIPLKPLFSRHKGIGVQFTFDPKDYLEQVNVDQMTYEKGEDDELHAVSAEDEILGEEKLSIENPVDTGKEGVYEVTYTVTSEEGQTSSIRLIVCVNQ